MEIRPNVVIVLARCSHTRRYYGIRFEEDQSMDQYPKYNFGVEPRPRWVADWAFEIEKETGGKEGYDKSEIWGLFTISATYPGCPHCHGRSFFRCRCGKVACWDCESQIVTCPYCGMTDRLSGQIDRLDSGDDR